MIVGTAGHIDHGKTALVRALTGVDTDRLPEEKARGITIDLGYAYATLDGGAPDAPIGFVDVPGHEQLVRTMVAGATGIDCALLVVAADDGVMPQTREHVAILALLGIARGAITITKVDLVDAARVAAVVADVRSLVADTPLAQAPCFEVNAVRGDGVPALRAWLASEAAHAHRAPRDDEGFRLAVDRSFTLAGAGTVVTGSVHAGRVDKGAHLTLAPALRPVRVRELHAQNRAAASAAAGERSALNLADVARTDVVRGDWIVDDDVALATTRIDATCRPLPGAETLLRTGTSVHLFVGAAHVTARVVVLREAAEGAEGARVQFVLAAPIAAWRGDRFIVRDAADARTLGGGTVLDPYGPARYRRTPERLAMLDALALADADARMARVLAIAADGVDLARHARAEARRAAALRVPEGTHRVTRGALDVALTPAAWARLADTLDARLVAFHAQHPDEMGPDLRRLHRIALPRVAEGLVAALVDDALARGTLQRTGPWLHKPGHDNRLSADERALFDRMLPGMRASPFDPPWVNDHATACGAPAAAVRGVLNRAAKRGEAFQVVRDLFYHPDAIRELADIAAAVQEIDGEVKAAAFRDRTGLGRKRAIQILEFFDRVGYTRRVRDSHVVRGDALRHVGAPRDAPAMA